MANLRECTRFLISEKSLELNITHELLREVERMQLDLAIALAQQTGTSTRPSSPPYAIGLPLDAERHRGVDVRLELPPSLNMGRAFLLQFKSPKPLRYSQKKGSQFSGTRTRPAPHCLFEINNNSHRDQHRVFEAYAKRYQLSAFYALPAVPSVSAFRAGIGDLVRMTSIIDVADVSRRARAAGINVNNGDVHHIAISHDLCRCEIRSTPVALPPREDKAPLVWSEIVTARVLSVLDSMAAWLPTDKRWREVVGRTLRATSERFVGALTHNAVPFDAKISEQEDLDGFDTISWEQHGRRIAAAISKRLIEVESLITGSDASPLEISKDLMWSSSILLTREDPYANIQLDEPFAGSVVGIYQVF